MVFYKEPKVLTWMKYKVSYSCVVYTSFVPAKKYFPTLRPTIHFKIILCMVGGAYWEHFFFPNEVVYVASDNFGLVSSIGKSQLLLKLTSGFLDFTGNFCHGGRSGSSRNCRVALGSMWHTSAKTYHFISLPRSSTSRDWARLTESESIAPFWHGKQTHLLCDS